MSVSSVDSKLCFPRWRNVSNSFINPCLVSECLKAQGSDKANYFHAMSANILVRASLQCNYEGLDLNSQQSSKTRGLVAHAHSSNTSHSGGGGGRDRRKSC